MSNVPRNLLRLVTGLLTSGLPRHAVFEEWSDHAQTCDSRFPTLGLFSASISSRKLNGAMAQALRPETYSSRFRHCSPQPLNRPPAGRGVRDQFL